MNVLANSLRRIWSAQNRVPHQTRWGTCGSFANPKSQITLAGLVYDSISRVFDWTRQAAPTIIFVVLNIFR